MKKFMPICISILLISLLRCGKEEAAAPTTTELEGTWIQTCTTIGGSPQKNTYVFSGLTNFSQTAVFYSDSNCSNQTFSAIATGTFAIGVALSTPSGGKKLDATAATYTVTPNTAAVATTFNNASFCGITTWSGGQTIDVTGKTCGSTVMGAGTVDHNIYTLSGSNLTLGDESGSNDGTNEGKRPTTLQSTPAVKQ